MKDLQTYIPGEKICHRAFGTGKILEIKDAGLNLKWKVKFADGDTKWINITTEQLEEMDFGEYSLTFEDVKEAVREVLNYDGLIGETEIAEKWRGGKVVFVPGNEDMAPYELPIDNLFHKIVMIRDRLRVLEQRINSHKDLDEDKKVELQQFVTRIYGSLTSFNILFRSREEGFVGQRGKK